MKKNITRIIYIVICFLVCMIPAVFMPWFSSQKTVGNESEIKLPQLTDAEGHVNTAYLSGLGDYFEQHYAFRPELITADAKVQAGLFAVTNTDSVITGKDGWLFYHSTLNDYMGREQLSERGMFNLAHNLALMQEYAQKQGSQFLFLAPANKNSLYPQYMPYYLQAPASAVRNRDRLADALSGEKVSYLDLFTLFREQDEVLYLKQDSHWNQKGALLVSSEILSLVGKEIPDAKSLLPTEGPSEAADLRNMIYPADADAESDLIYPMDSNYSYIPNPASSNPVSVEDFRIETENSAAAGSLLMYRDSFGNTLLPWLANAYGHGYFSKAVPYTLAKDMQQYKPDTVIVELVERNIRNLAMRPPILPAPERDPDPETMRQAEPQELNAQPCSADTSYLEISGTLPADAAAEKVRIYLSVPDKDGNTGLYEAYTVRIQENDYGFVMYLPQADLLEDLTESLQENVQIYVK